MQRIVMNPSAGERLLRYVGDRLRFTLAGPKGDSSAGLGKAFLRTSLGQAESLRREITQSLTGDVLLRGGFWRDIPMRWMENEFHLELSLTEVGYFEAKAYFIDPQGRQHWPEGANTGITVHPGEYRTGNMIYCAFVRMFGPSKEASSTVDQALDTQLAPLDKSGYTVIPPSGKLRDLIKEIPHIFDVLGCRILHLLPINPTPTTYARFGRFGSPYAGGDLTAVDPALVVFDRETTGIDQFQELAWAVHAKGGRLFLDLVINHTGWGSPMQENHPEWFLCTEDGTFVSPGAWGVVWEDLVELNHRIPDSWQDLAQVFLTWCRRGVDGFRCDAGYKIPKAAWRYITACVRQEFPEALFLLEGLGGSWEATELLLTDGGMQWAYSELFQNYGGPQVGGYLDHSFRQGERVGILAHYSETHDNERLAAKGSLWSLMRNRLCALTSQNGAYGFTCGVEWLAAERVNVHQSRALNWNSPKNLLTELSTLNKLLADHPCFYDGAVLTRLSHVDSSVYALRRESGDHLNVILVLVNLDIEKSGHFQLKESAYKEMGEPSIDLLGQPALIPKTADDLLTFTVPPGGSYCLSGHAQPAGLAGEGYRVKRLQASLAIKALSKFLPPECFGPYDWTALADMVQLRLKEFLGCLAYLDPEIATSDLLEAITSSLRKGEFPKVVSWEMLDLNRITLVPPGHWLLVLDSVPFRATLERPDREFLEHAQAVPVADGYAACFSPSMMGVHPSVNDLSLFRDSTLKMERYAAHVTQATAQIRFLKPQPQYTKVRNIAPDSENARRERGRFLLEEPLVLLTNGRGAMARVRMDLGSIQSKYDCLLAANLHPRVPVDRHVFAKRARIWINADGFIWPLNRENLISFEAGPPARWCFLASAGAGRSVEVHLTADMIEGQNTTVLHFSRPGSLPVFGQDPPPGHQVSLTVRIDIEDRSFHSETRRNAAADHHFSTNTRALADQIGFEFTPAADRKLTVVASSGRYAHESEWCENIPHMIERTRGQNPGGDAYSPGWFELTLPKGSHIALLLSAETSLPSFADAENSIFRRIELVDSAVDAAKLTDTFGQQLASAAQAFVARRNEAKTVIAGYPWFLDWGRDSLIAARGLLAGGMLEEVRELLITFGRFEQNGTLPNIIHGEDASNRDTSDAPLWYGIVCEEAAALIGTELYEVRVDKQERTIADVLCDLATGYRNGTPNGIRMDQGTALIWSPSHFTWMDTNYPAGTPREGYPIEIQALWIKLLRQLDRLGLNARNNWAALAEQAENSLRSLFWLKSSGYLSDLLIAKSGVGAMEAAPDDALRSNSLFAVTFGLLETEQARSVVEMARKYLVVPGALRTLAPLPVKTPLGIHGNNGGLLNNPLAPYWGRYEGDEDTRRKPAYHNGTAWTWTFPSFCEALASAWDNSPNALAAAKAYLGSMDRLLVDGCIGQLPEILDGDIPHTRRGCDAQAWGVTEALRVWKLLNGKFTAGSGIKS